MTWVRTPGFGNIRYQRPSWCSTCWARAVRGCAGKGHALISVGDAQRTAREAFDKARDALKTCQYRLDDTLGAGESLILKVSVPAVEEDSCIAGGTLTIKLNVIGGLTKKEKDSVIAAMMGADGEGGLECYPAADDSAIAAQGNLDSERIEPVLHKFPQCAVGQELPAGTVLLSCDVYDIYDRDLVAASGDHILGQVTDGLDDSLRTHGHPRNRLNPNDDETGDYPGSIVSTNIVEMHFESPEPVARKAKPVNAPGKAARRGRGRGRGRRV